MISDKKNILSFSIFHYSYLIRKGLKEIIESIGQNKVIGSFENISSLKRYILQDNPDIIIISSGLLDDKLLKEIRENQTATKLILLKSDEEDDNKKIKGFIDTIGFGESKDSIIRKLRQVLTMQPAKEAPDDKLELTDREKLVVKCIAKGLTNKEMADQLFLSPHTIITHRKNITRKLGIKTVSGLTVYALLNNIIDIDEVQ